jgi:hypothetical protein
MPRVEPGVELEKDDGKADGGQRRQVVTQPPAGDPQHKHREHGRRGHDQELRDQVVRVLAGPDRHRDRGEDCPEPDQDDLQAQFGGRQVGLPDPVGNPGDDRPGGHGVDERKLPAPGLRREAEGGPGSTEQRIGGRRPRGC